MTRYLNLPTRLPSVLRTYHHGQCGWQSLNKHFLNLSGHPVIHFFNSRMIFKAVFVHEISVQSSPDLGLSLNKGSEPWCGAGILPREGTTSSL